MRALALSRADSQGSIIEIRSLRCEGLREGWHMQLLRDILEHAQKNTVAIGHSNVADLVLLRAVFSSAQELNVPVLVGASAGERAFQADCGPGAKSSGRIRLPDFPQRRPYPLPPGRAVAALITQA